MFIIRTPLANASAVLNDPNPIPGLTITKRIGTIPAHTSEDDVRFVVTPLERVELDHGDESEQMQSSTLPPAIPVFATQPAEESFLSYTLSRLVLDAFTLGC